jgi:pimeloyl-ACP methyl ester carboxylesterase
MRYSPLALAFLLSLPLAAAAKEHRHMKKPAGPTLPGLRVEFVTQDSWTIVGSFQPPAQPGRWTFLLLHGVGSGRGEWGALAARLAVEGYGILAYDGRGHGESQVFSGQKLNWRKFGDRGVDNDWNRTLFDVEAALRFLASKGIESSSVAFCGASMGANVLLKAAAQRKEIPLLILLSPGINYRDVMTVNPIRAYGKRPLMIVAAQSDNYAFQSSQLLYQLAMPLTGADKAIFLQAPDRHGAPMLDNPAVMDAVLAWIRAQEKGEPFSLALSTAPVAPSTPTARPGP